MRKFLFPIRLLLAFISILCLILSYQGLEYLNFGWYLTLMLLLGAEFLLTIYDICARKQNILENDTYQSLGIGLFLYVTILYMRLFFDYGILYNEGNLLQRFGLIDDHLIILCIGMFGYLIYHICIEIEKNTKQKSKRKKK